MVNDSVPIPIVSFTAKPLTSVTKMEVLGPVVLTLPNSTERPQVLLLTVTFLAPLNSVKSDVLIPLIIRVSPFATSCGILVIPTISFLFFTSSVSVKVVTPICTVEIGLPKTDPTTIFAPVPSVPVPSRSNTSSTLYPSPLEKIVTEEIPELLILVTSNSCFKASLTSSIKS